MSKFLEIIGNAMREDEELFELAKWGEIMFFHMDKKLENEVAKIYPTEEVYNQENEDWNFPEPPNICR